MNWPLAISVAYLAVGGGLLLIGARTVLSALSMRTVKKPAPAPSSRQLVLGPLYLAVGATMLLTTESLVGLLAGVGAGD